VDVAFTRKKVAIFVDGCFWHRCPMHKTAPANNAAWWASKLEMNVRRDREVDEHLTAMGWAVLRFWEHDALDDVIRTTVAALAEPSRHALAD
jgi:DNA mismatch endonuclease (patch repair protein)